MESDIMYGAPYWRWLDKKLAGNNSPMATLQRRTMNTACTILTTIRDLPFSKLSATLYFFCADVETREFARLYESQLELAGAAPEKFAKGLHKFYNDVSNKIKKENRYADFFDFVSLCGRMRLLTTNPNVDISVVNCYYSLLLQNLEYLRPDKFDFNVALCGMKTSGKLLTVKDSYPNLDTPAHTLEQAVRENRIRSNEELQAMVVQEYGKAGYKEVKSLDDVERLTNIDRVFTNHIAALLPFINEYTYDLLPQKYFTTLVTPFLAIQVATPTEKLMEMLRHRSATLPANGVVFQFPNPFVVLEVQMKETFYNDRIYMLYRMDTILGELAGYYDTQDGFLYSVLLDASDHEGYERAKNLLLYLYASVVTKHGPKMQQAMPLCCWYEAEGLESRKIPMQVDVFGRGGKLKNVFDPEPETEHRKTRKGSDDYEREDRAIQGFIRKVGKGKTPSPQAIEYAKSLGYELAADETYVRPFIRRVLRLKEKGIAE